MKKSFSLLLCFLLCLGEAAVFAEDYDSVDLELQLGSYVAFVNGETLSTEAPFLADGVTVASVEILSAAFGKQENDSITYDDVKITFTEGSNIAIVNEEEKVMPTKALMVNNTLMVPVRFICDTYGALIEYEDATGIIRITKSADFTELFDRTVSGYWCDEDYGWMIQLPTEYDHKVNVYDGSENQFYNSEMSAAFLVSVEKNTYESIEHARNYMLAQNAAELIRKEELISLSDGTKAFYIEFYDSLALLTIHGEHFYAIEFLTASESLFEQNKEVASRAVLTFTFEIDTTKNPENISELNEGGFKLYTDKLLGFSVNRLESWTEPTYQGIYSTIWKYKKYPLLSTLNSDEAFSAQMQVTIFSSEEGDTPELLAQKTTENVRNSFNKKYLSDIKVFPVQDRNELEGTQIEYELEYSGKKQINKTKFFVKDGYFYKADYVAVYYTKTDEAKLNLDEINKMFDSIRIEGVNASKMGTILDVSRRVNKWSAQTQRDETNSFSINLPSSWVVSCGAETVASVNPSNYFSVEAFALEGISSLEELRRFYAEMFDDAKFTKCNFAGKAAYQFETNYMDNDDDDCRIRAYIFVNGKKAYTVAAEVKEIYTSDFNMKKAEEILRTFKLL